MSTSPVEVVALYLRYICFTRIRQFEHSETTTFNSNLKLYLSSFGFKRKGDFVLFCLQCIFGELVCYFT